MNLFFQQFFSILTFRENIVDNLTYVDWESNEAKGHPKIFSKQDFETLKNSDKLFARKFDMQRDAEIFDLLEAWMKRQEMYVLK